jgi:hypothetical protein
MNDSYLDSGDAKLRGAWNNPAFGSKLSFAAHDLDSGRKASLRPRRRSSGQIKPPVTAPQATKLKTMLTKNRFAPA